MKKPLAWVALFVLALLLVGGIAGGIAAQALPGSGLYPLKTGVLERMQALFKSDPQARFSYLASRFDTRIQEASRLHANAGTSAEAAAALRDEVMREEQSFYGSLPGAGLSPADTVALSNDVAAKLTALEYIAEHDAKFDSVSDSLDEARRDAENRFEDSASSLAETNGPAVMTDYMAAALTEVQASLSGTEMRRDLRSDTETMLQNANDAMGKGKLLRAFTVSANALRFIKANALIAGLTFEEQPKAPKQPKQQTSTSSPESASTTQS